jgi:site-specific recombinase XerC
MRHRDASGTRRLESTNTEDWDEAQRRLRERLQARDNRTLEVVRRGEQLTYKQWADFFLESYSKPPIRAQKTHEANERAMKHLQATFGSWRLVDITADDIERYLRARLKKRARVKTREGFRELGILKATTVHQEFRVLRRALNIAVRKKFLPANPCAGVEFPVSIRGLFRPHYVTWSKQQMIEFHAPEHLRNVVRIITETGLRVYKELLPMRKDQVDLTTL